MSTSDTPEKPPRKKGKKPAPPGRTPGSRNLTKKQWAEIAAMWSLGEATLADMSGKYGVAKETISRKMKAMGVKRGERARQHIQTVQEEVARATVDDALVLAERIRQSKEIHYKNADLLSKLAMGVLANARKNGHPLAVAEPDLKAIERAAKIQDITMSQKWTALGLDKEDPLEGELPELTIREMTAEEMIEAQKAAEQMAAGSMDMGEDIEVLEGALEEDQEG